MRWAAFYIVKAGLLSRVSRLLLCQIAVRRRHSFLTSKRPMIPITTSKTLHVALMVFASMVRPPKRWCCPGGEASPLDIVSRADGAEAGHRRRQDERKQAIEEAEKFANPSKKLVARVLSGITTCLWHNSPCECGTLCATYCCSILPEK